MNFFYFCYICILLGTRLAAGAYEFTVDNLLISRTAFLLSVQEINSCFTSTLEGPLLTHQFSSGGRSKHENFTYLSGMYKQHWRSFVYFCTWSQCKMYVNFSPFNVVAAFLGVSRLHCILLYTCQTRWPSTVHREAYYRPPITLGLMLTPMLRCRWGI